MAKGLKESGQDRISLMRKSSTFLGVFWFCSTERRDFIQPGGTRDPKPGAGVTKYMSLASMCLGVSY